MPPDSWIKPTELLDLEGEFLQYWAQFHIVTQNDVIRSAAVMHCLTSACTLTRNEGGVVFGRSNSHS